MPRASRLLAFCLVALLVATVAPAAEPPRVLVVTAHPDDDALFSGALYKVTHSLGGLADLALLTNGEGGYKYSTLAEPIYGKKLTDEAVGRAWLPSIRKQELMAGGAVVGFRNYFFFDQVDSGYTKDMAALLGGEWDLAYIRKRLGEILKAGRYDLVFLMPPTADTHAHHRAAALFALEAVAALPEAEQPVALLCAPRGPKIPAYPAFTGYPGYPLSNLKEGAPSFVFDRTQKFGLNNQLDYTIIANWVIAEHRSQGTMQNLIGAQTEEVYHYLDLNGEDKLPRTKAFFERLIAAPVLPGEPGQAVGP